MRKGVGVSEQTKEKKLLEMQRDQNEKAKAFRAKGGQDNKSFIPLLVAMDEQRFKELQARLKIYEGKERKI